jgi:ribosomal protein L13E
MHSRAGRGFSLGEYVAAEVPEALARRWGASSDQRRRSVLEANVSALKTWFSSARKMETAPKQAKVEKPKKAAPRKKKAPAG